MEDIIHITYGDLDNKTILENIDGKLEVQTDETIGRTASGALTVIQGGIDITMKEDKGVVSRVVRLLTNEDLNTIVGETIHARQADSNNIISGMNYPVMEAGYLEVMYSGADNCTHQRYTTYNTDIIFTRRFSDTLGWSAWKEIGTGSGGGGTGDGYSKAEADAKFVDASGDNIDGDLYIRGQVHSIKNIGDSYIGVEDETNTDAMFMSLNETSMTLYNKTDVSEGNIVQVDRATGAVDSDYFVKKSGDEMSDTLSVKGAHATVTAMNSDDVNRKIYLASGSWGAGLFSTTTVDNQKNVFTYHSADERVSSDVFPLLSSSNSFSGNATYRHESGERYIMLQGSDGDNMYMDMTDAYMQMYYSIPSSSIAGIIYRIHRDTGVVEAPYLRLSAEGVINNANLISPEELSEYETVIQNEIIDLETRIEKANTKGFMKLVVKLQSQLDILNQKLAEVI